MEAQKYTPIEVLDSTIAILDGIMLPKGMTAGEAAYADAAVEHDSAVEVSRLFSVPREKIAQGARRLLAENPAAVLTCDETGSGIVPLDPFERRWREETGRALGILCADARTRLVRVWYGLPEVLK